MPVDGAGFRQQVGDLECDGVAFAPAQGGAGDDAIDGGCRAGLAGDVDVGATQSQVEGVTGKRGGAGVALTGQQLGGCQTQPQTSGSERQALHETASWQGKRGCGFHDGSPDCLSGTANSNSQGRWP